MTIELSKEEFAYMLAAVEAASVIGIEDPKLFPSQTKSRETIYRNGREQLESNGWLTEIKDHDDEHDLNVDLFRLIAVVGEPKYVLGTSIGATKKDRKWMLHYLHGDYIVELWATQAKTYMFQVVADRQALTEHLAEALELEPAAQDATFSIDEAELKKVISFSARGQSEKAIELLNTKGEAASSLVGALAADPVAQLSFTKTETGEIIAGRRASVYGADGNAWMVWRESQESPDMKITACDASHIDGLLSEWMEQFPVAIDA